MHQQLKYKTISEGISSELNEKKLNKEFLKQKCQRNWKFSNCDWKLSFEKFTLTFIPGEIAEIVEGIPEEYSGTEVYRTFASRCTFWK